MKQITLINKKKIKLLNMDYIDKNDIPTPPAVPLSPMLAQYLEIKSRHKDAILFFRLGDFYEMFYEDAVKAAPILGVQLTIKEGVTTRTTSLLTSPLT